MSFFDGDNSWAAQGRQPSWEQQSSSSRSGATSATSHQAEPNAFASQYEEIERATDNLMRTGKWFPGAATPGSGAASRRDSVPSSGRGYEYGSESRASSRHHSSAGDFDAARPGSAGLQGYYAGQRFPPRQNEAEQMLQVKRRMAAQRERELRNYHQEQQYNRRPDASGAKSERSMSPNTMSEEDRRDLIARQHRALYGDNSSLYNADAAPAGRPQSQDIRLSAVGRGPSPRAFDPFAHNQAQSGAESAVQMPPRDRSTAGAISPAGNAPTQQSLNILGDAQQSGRTSASSPTASPPLQGQPKGAGGVAPIGTRPPQASGPASAINKRSTTPLTPSSLSYGFGSADSQSANNGNTNNNNNNKDERSTSAASNPALTGEKGVSGLGGAWGSNSGVWGKNTLGAQASVWG